MSHEIDSAMFAEKPAWHGLGTVVDEAPTSQDAFKLAGLAWDVNPVPLYRNVGKLGEEPVFRKVEGHVANVRDDSDEVLGVVSDSYRVVQNADAFAFTDSLVESEDIKYESAGSLKDGRVIWLLARMPECYEPIAGDKHHPYLLFVNSHDGSMAVRIQPNDVRVVCWNTLRMSLTADAEKQAFWIRHTGDIADKIEQARTALGLIRGQWDAYRTYSDTLLRTMVTQQNVDAFARAMFSDDKQKCHLDRRLRVWDLFAHDTRCNVDGMEGTAYALLNAFTQFQDHEMTVRAADDDVRALRRFESNWIGRSSDRKVEAMNALNTVIDLTPAG